MPLRGNHAEKYRSASMQGHMPCKGTALFWEQCKVPSREKLAQVILPCHAIKKPGKVFYTSADPTPTQFSYLVFSIDEVPFQLGSAKSLEKSPQQPKHKHRLWPCTPPTTQALILSALSSCPSAKADEDIAVESLMNAPRLKKFAGDSSAHFS